MIQGTRAPNTRSLALHPAKPPRPHNLPPTSVLVWVLATLEKGEAAFSVKSEDRCDETAKQGCWEPPSLFSPY